MARTKFTGSANGVLSIALAFLSSYGRQVWQYAFPPIKKLPYQGMTAFYWCMWLVVWCYRGVGYDITRLVTNWAYCPAVRLMFIASPDWVRVSPSNASPADVTLYLNRGLAYHTGLVLHPGNDALVYTIEGDTSSPAFPGSDSAGGAIATRTRSVYDQSYGNYSMEIWHCTLLPANASELPGTKLAIDGVAGPATFAAFARVIHASQMSYAITYMQEQLNAHHYLGANGQPLATDGVGLYTNDGATPPATNTVFALQRAFGFTGAKHTGVMDTPTVKAWQAALNAGRIF